MNQVLAADRPTRDASLLRRSRARTGRGRVQRLGQQTWLLASGMPADGRAILEHARAVGREYADRFGEEMTGASLAAEVSTYVHHCGSRPDRRALASAVILAYQGREVGVQAERRNGSNQLQLIGRPPDVRAWGRERRSSTGSAQTPPWCDA